MLSVFRYGVGLGKTVVSLTALVDRLWDWFTVKKALVIAPKNVAETVWDAEIEKWDHLKGLRAVKVLGTAKQRISALQTPADLYIINRENVVWLVEYLGAKWPFDMVILDELSSFKSASSKRWRALRRVINSI